MDTKKFASDLYKSCLLGREETNVFLSPPNISAALNLVLLAANNNTEKQLMNLLCLSAGTKQIASIKGVCGGSENCQLVLANNNFLSSQFTPKEEFLQKCQEVESTKLTLVDFADVDGTSIKINSWVKEETHDLIEKIVEKEDLDRDTILVIVSTVYFKGGWRKIFLESQTKPKAFYLLDKSEVTVPMMFNDDRFHIADHADLHCQSLQLGFDDDFSLIVVLPNERDGLKGLLAAVAADKSGQLLNRILFEGFQFTFVELSLPRFKISSDINLKAPITELGATDLFTAAADFSRMSDVPLKVSHIVHKTFLDVNEKGVEAAAVTGASFKMLSAVMNPDRFVVDHPFMVAIVNNKENEVVFLGHVTNPL